MMISSKGRYALRVMLDLADCPPGSFVSLNDIAYRQNISRKYLESIMNVLCKHALAESAVGKGGGYRLSRLPEEITAGQILRAAEGQLIPVSCLDESGKKCSGECACSTLPFWRGLEERINSYIDSYTLRDLVSMQGHRDSGDGPHCSCNHK